MKTFRVTRRVQIIFLVVLLVLLSLAIFFGFLFFSLTTSLSSSLGNPRTLFSLLFPLICSGPFLLMAAWIGLNLVALRRTRLTFNDQELVFETIDRFAFLLQRGLRPFQLAYALIKNVKFNGLSGFVEIVDVNGKKRILLPGMFDKNHGEDVLIELQKHVAVENFMSGMEISAVRQKWSRDNKRRNAWAAFFLILYIATFFFDPQFSSRSWLIDAWQVEMHPFWNESVWTYSMDSNDNFWVVSSRLSDFRVYHFSDQRSKEWQLPKTFLGEHYPQQVSADQSGNPIAWFENGVYQYNGGDWKRVLYADGLDLGGWHHRGVVSGEQGWAIGTQGENTILLNIDAMTGKWSQVPLPESARAQNLQPLFIRRAVNGDLLVLMLGENGIRVYVLSEDQWKPQEYSVVVPQAIGIRDYFLDAHGSLWVMFDGAHGTAVEKIEVTSELQVTQLPSPQESDEWERYDELIVDSSGRLWVTGGYPYFMSVFKPAWDEYATEIVRYTEDNSNFQSDFLSAPILSSDGRIWSFNRKITTMDTNVSTLPSPLPAWLTEGNLHLVRFCILLIQLLIYLVLHIAATRPISRKQQVRV